MTWIYQRNDSGNSFRARNDKTQKQLNYNSKKVVVFYFNNSPTCYVLSQFPYPYTLVHNAHNG